MADAKDLFGHARLWTDGTVTPGAIETQGRYTGVIADFSLTGAKQGRAPFAATFHAEASGGTGPYTYTWTFGDGTASETTSSADITHTYTEPGLYDVSLVVTPAEGEAVTVPTKAGCALALGDTCYVSETGSATKPYDTWEKATSSIEDALALSPDTVLVTNGTYQLANANGIELARAVTVKSVEGPDVTFVRSPDNSTMNRRAVTLSHSGALVDGFSFLETYHTAFVMSAGTLSHCIVTNIKSICKVYHADISGGTVSDCRFDFNGSSPYDENICRNAAGIHLSGSAVLDRCEISGYRISYPEDSGRTWPNVGGIRMEGTSVMRNCYVHDMSYTVESYVSGGGVAVMGSGCTVENCTIVSNRIATANGGTLLGSGIYVSGTGAKIRNTIVWSNTVNGVSHDFDVADAATGLVFENNLLANAAELPTAATDCVTGDPRFLDDGAGYRFGSDSPCVDAGRVLDWCRRRRMATDLDGQERRRNHPDIGCFEVQREMGFILLVK